MANLAPYRTGDMASSAPFGEGTYRLRVHAFTYEDVDDAVSGVPGQWKSKHPQSDSKDPYLQVETVVQDDVDGTGAPILGRHLWTTLSFKKGGDFMLRQLIEACGKDEEWMLIDEHGQSHWDDLKDAEVLGVVTLAPAKEVKGKKYDARNEVKKFLPLV